MTEQIADGSPTIPEDSKFTVVLNGQRDLEQQLMEFKKACEAHERHRRKRRRRRYYNLGLMAKMDCSTTKEEVRRLLKNGTRTISVDIVTNKDSEINQMSEIFQEAVSELQFEDPDVKHVIGFGLEITGDCCRVGRLRNNCSVFLEKDSTVTLTVDSSYRYSGYKEICYVINLKYYLPVLNLNDEIKLGYEVRGRVVKKLKGSIALEISEAGIINSYEYLELPNQCYSLLLKVLPEMFEKDLDMAIKLHADFVIIPKLRCFPFLKLLSLHLKKCSSVKLIGAVDLEYVSERMLDIMSIIRMLDVLWLTNLFNLTSSMYAYICHDVLPIAKCLNKPLIGSVPLERCSDFHILKNHEFLWKIDCIYIEKSKWCNKYPIIVKKLLPVKDYRMGVFENTLALRKILSSYQSIVNFIIRTITSIECQAIFLHSNCETAAAALGRVEIYCPVYVVLPLDSFDEQSEEEMQCHIKLAKLLNLRRNLWPIIYTKEMNENEHPPIDFGIEYARGHGCIDTGDFVITIEVAKDGGDENVQLGVGEDVVIMRSFYVAPKKIGERHRC